MKKKEIIFSLLLIMFISLGCPDDTEIDSMQSGPEIEWISGGTVISYSYSGGVLSGFNFHRSFKVLNESGKVSVDVQVQGDKDSKVSGTFNVEKGKQYDLKVKGSKKSSKVSSPGNKCLTVVFSSPNCSSKQEIQISSYAVPSYNEWVGDTYYCPTAFTFGEIIISE
jgi:hypothetical protein